MSKVKLVSHTKNVVTLPKGMIIEITNEHFNQGSGIFLPCGNDHTKPTGLNVIKAVFKFVQEFPAKKMMISGHVGTVTSAKKDFSLSGFRARAANSVLTGSASQWVKIAKMSTIADYKRILKYVDAKYGWACDPKSDDTTVTDDYKAAVKKFKESYNTAHTPKPPLKITDTVDASTLAAFFNLYQAGLAELLGEANVDGLKTWRKSLKFMDANAGSKGCGTSINLMTLSSLGAKSTTGDRVEFTFFNEKNCPKLKCLTSSSAEHNLDKCPVGSKAVFRKYLDSQNVAAGPAGLLQITAATDKQFAPQAESLSIAYDIKNLAANTVVLQVTSDTYKENPVFERALTDAEKADGTGKIITWNGETSCKGELEGLFINPLYSPYKVILKSVGGAESFAEVKVVYGKIILEKGPWDAGRPAANAQPDEATEPADWIRYRLNDLGYWGGPATNNESDNSSQNEYLRRAAAFYARNSAEIQARGSFNVNNAIAGKDVLFKDQLRTGRYPRTGFVDPSNDVFTNAAGTAKMFVPSLYYAKTKDFMAGGESRFKNDRKQLNDPVVPVLAKIQLLDKNGNSVDAPEAVGKVNLAWHVEDPVEPDTATRYNVHVAHGAGNRHTPPNDPDIHPFNAAAVPPTDDICRLNYISQVTAWIAAQGFTYTDGTPFNKNCPESCGGKRRLTDIFWSYRPFVYSSKGTRPCTEASTLNEVLGKTGIYFRPSAIGGDSYRIVVDFDFSHNKNKAVLDLQYPRNLSGETALVQRTGVFTVWRDTAFANIIAWPGASALAEYELDRVKANYEQAYIDMQTPAAADVIDVTAVIDNNDYHKIIKPFNPAALKNIYQNQSFTGLSAADRKAEANRFVSDSAVSGANLASWVLTKDCVYGRALPAQNLISGPDYQSALDSLMYHTANGFIYKVLDTMSRFVGEKYRKNHPYGHAIIAFSPHKPITILADPVALPGSVMTANYVSGFVSVGQPDGIVCFDLGDGDRRGYVITHEFGHHDFLYHHENAGDRNPRHHDTNDHNCMMSYPGGVAPAISQESNPLFCGKCNLRLRGWEITGKNVPAHS